MPVDGNFTAGDFSGPDDSGRAEAALSVNKLRFQRALKRSFDVLAASAALVVLSPLLLVVAFLISRDGGPVLFAQPRPGRGGKTFRCLKFRTMCVDAEERLRRILDEDPEQRRMFEQKAKLLVDPRITPVGRVLRRLSLDELPQLINIVRGDMSVVGPRPRLMSEMEQPELRGADFDLYFTVRPGLTGLWQVSGRNNTTVEEKVALDARYVRNWSFLTDVWIILKTIPAVVKGDGAI